MADQHSTFPRAAAAEAALTESRTLRAQYAARIDVLDKVKALQMLPDDLSATTEIVAAYFQVSTSTITSLAAANSAELDSNGRRVLSGAELREFASPFGGLAKLGLHHNTRTLALYDRRAMLNVAMLLRDSQVARDVRTYLLDAEAELRRIEAEALTRRQVGDPISFTWFETVAIVRQRYGISFNVATFRRRLRQAGVLKQTMEPKAKHASKFWFTGDAWDVNAHAIPELVRTVVQVDQELRAFTGIQLRLELDGVGLPALPGGDR